MSEAVSALGEDVLEIKLPICGERLVHLEEQYQAKLESGSEANVLFATLGNMRDEVFLFREASTQLHHKDRIILCSDGVWGVAPKFGHALQQLSDQGNNFDRICAFLNARSADSADDGSFIVAEVLA
jgi:serine/threonine protein phosphatase PrpC